MSSYVSAIYVKANFLGLILIIAAFVIFYLKFKKYKIKEYNRLMKKRMPFLAEDIKNETFPSWMIGHFSRTFFLIVSFVLLLLIIVNILFCSTTIYQNRMKEPILYNTIIVEQKSIKDCLNSTNDIINTELYTKAIDFNKKLTDIKDRSKNPNYKLNFTGDYNWEDIDFITFN